MNKSKIADARRRAALTQGEVSHALGRDRVWISLIERGKLQPSQEIEARVLRAISRLAQYKIAVRRNKEKLIKDLRLPSARRGAAIE